MKKYILYLEYATEGINSRAKIGEYFSYDEYKKACSEEMAKWGFPNPRFTRGWVGNKGEMYCDFGSWSVYLVTVVEYMRVIGIKDYTFKATPYVYLHGELEKENGFDGCYVTHLPEADGMYECKVIIDNNAYAGKFYYWTKSGKDRGLIVKAGDIEAEEFAEEKFKERAEFL